MARKKGQRTEEETVQKFYDLKTKAVDDLVNADSTNTPKYSEEELKKYRSKGGVKVPDLLKVFFIKFWFPAAVCFFFIWGLSGFLADLLDLLVVTAIALGIVTDLLTDNVLRFFAPTDGAFDRYIMFAKKRYATFFLNILYAGALMFLVYTLYNAINVGLIFLLGMPGDSVPLGVEPILFGVFYVLADGLLLLCRNTVVKVIADARQKAA